MKKLVVSFISLLFMGFAFAQSADVITEIEESKESTFGQVCYLSAVHQGLVGNKATYDQAIEALYNEKQIPSLVSANDVIPMANLAFIYAQMWNLKGGIMYRLTKGSPRYAFKQLKTDGIIPANADPTQAVSGIQVLNYYTSCSMLYGNEQISVDDEVEKEVGETK